MNVEDKLYKNRFRVDQERPHIKINKDICEDCNDKQCLYCCPVQNYKLDDNGITQEVDLVCVFDMDEKILEGT